MGVVKAVSPGELPPIPVLESFWFTLGTTSVRLYRNPIIGSSTRDIKENLPFCRLASISQGLAAALPVVIGRGVAHSLLVDTPT